MLKSVCHQLVTFSVFNFPPYKELLLLKKYLFVIKEVLVKRLKKYSLPAHGSLSVAPIVDKNFSVYVERSKTFLKASKKRHLNTTYFYPLIMNSPDLEVSYYISTGEFLLQAEPSNILIEEERYGLFLRQLRYEEYIDDGLKKKREYSLLKNEKTFVKVMSYNVLSQQLLEQHRYLYRWQLPVVLRWDYRHPRLLAEISQEDPDILCLQEVQASHMDSFYSKLENMGYKGVFKVRTGGKMDGCAIYYKSELFTLSEVSLVEYFQPRVSQLNRDNVGIVLRLQLTDSPAHSLVIATTHLLYNPRRGDIRLAQMQLFLAEVDRLVGESREKCVGVIITGDMNSKPDSPVVKLLTEGSVSHSYPPLPPRLGILNNCKHLDPTSVRLFNSLQNSVLDEEDMSPLPQGTAETYLSNECRKYGPHFDGPEEQTEITHGFKFQSVYSTKDSMATTYHDDWVIVDYIFYSEKLELLSRLRLPTEEECSRFIKYLPNYASPSDHLPLVATFAVTLQ